MKRLLYIMGWVLWAVPQVQGQPVSAGEWAWKPLFAHEGVEFFYIFYNKANNVNNGVVILLNNTNDYAIAYRFKVVFRSGETEAVRRVEGRLRAGESKTGDSDGLFWVPFLDGQEIEQVGLRGYTITPVESREPSVPEG